MIKPYYVYILSNKRHAVLYTGVTNDLKRRVYEHKEKLIPGFTASYKVNELVYYEECRDIKVAIAREKQIKGGTGQKKLDLINGFNPEWSDLFEQII